MNSDFAGDDPFEFVSGGFAAAATEPKIFSPMLGVTCTISFEPGIVASIFRSAYEKIKSYISGEGRPLTVKEFRETLSCDGLINSFRQVLKEYAQENGMTEHELYLRTIKVIREHNAYRNIGDDDKVELARRLTVGLL